MILEYLRFLLHLSDVKQPTLREKLTGSTDLFALIYDSCCSEEKKRFISVFMSKENGMLFLGSLGQVQISLIVIKVVIIILLLRVVCSAHSVTFLLQWPDKHLEFMAASQGPVLHQDNNLLYETAWGNTF